MNQHINLLGKSRIKIFIGEFGSGKTELAVNYSLSLVQGGHKTAVVDIDLVKPYFRTRENRALLEKNGVILVAPEHQLAHSDLPIMPSNLTRVIYDQDCNVIMDVGGGDSAVVLGQINQQLNEKGYEAQLVINTMRPFTNTTEGIVTMLERIERISRLKVSGFICNTNLAQETTAQHILRGLKTVEEVAGMLKLPINWVVVPEWLQNEVIVDYPVFVLKPYTQYPWMG
ncbi:hypothetical protein SDC9_30329 [bioreactor metagenome]|uniref:CobQ/CobB/MinD/ParA nucleotide binding domain-containing protein n=1 Tax=bioreactor metagenome TaxID=1076179 RepID=A0A644UZJ1_9ZZZZ|nr:hypothetical protein [Negativicutes bacterium]